MDDELIRQLIIYSQLCHLMFIFIVLVLYWHTCFYHINLSAIEISQYQAW